MLIGDFDTTPLRHTALFRDAKVAMLTHRVLFHMDMTAAAADKVEEALAKLLDATAAEVDVRPPVRYRGPVRSEPPDYRLRESQL